MSLTPPPIEWYSPSNGLVHGRLWRETREELVAVWLKMRVEQPWVSKARDPYPYKGGFYMHIVQSENGAAVNEEAVRKRQFTAVGQLLPNK